MLKQNLCLINYLRKRPSPHKCGVALADVYRICFQDEQDIPDQFLSKNVPGVFKISLFSMLAFANSLLILLKDSIKSSKFHSDFPIDRGRYS